MGAGKSKSGGDKPHESKPSGGKGQADGHKIFHDAASGKGGSKGHSGHPEGQKHADSHAGKGIKDAHTGKGHADGKEHSDSHAGKSAKHEAPANKAPKSKGIFGMIEAGEKKIASAAHNFKAKIEETATQVEKKAERKAEKTAGQPEKHSAEKHSKLDLFNPKSFIKSSTDAIKDIKAEVTEDVKIVKKGLRSAGKDLNHFIDKLQSTLAPGEHASDKTKRPEKLTQQQRAAAGLKEYEDSKTHTTYKCDDKGRVTDVERKGFHTHIDYKANSNDVASFVSRDGSGRALGMGSADEKVHIKVDQETGEVIQAFAVNQLPKDKRTPNRLPDARIENRFKSDGTVDVVHFDKKGHHIAKEIQVPGSKGPETVSRAMYYHYDAKGKLTFDPDKIDDKKPVALAQYDGQGRLTDRYQFKDSKQAGEQRASFHEHVKYYEDQNRHARTEQHLLYDLSKPDHNKPFQTVVKTHDTETGGTTIDTTAKNGDSTHVRYDGEAKPVEYRRQESNHKFEYSLKNGKVVGLSQDGHTLKGDAADKFLLSANIELAKTTRDYHPEKYNPKDDLKHFAPTAPREGKEPSGTLVYNDGSGKVTQFKVENGQVKDGKKVVGSVQDNGEVTLNGKTFNILSAQEGTAFHGVGSDKNRLDLVDKKNAESGFNGVMTSPDGKQTMLSMGGNLYDEKGNFRGHLENGGKVHLPGRTYAENGTDVNSQFQNWSFKGMEAGKQREFVANNELTRGKMFIPDPKTLAPAEYEVRLGMLINKQTGQQFGRVEAPHPGANGQLEGGCIYPANGGAPIPLQSFAKATFDLHPMGDPGGDSTNADSAQNIQGICLGPAVDAAGRPIPGRGGFLNVADARYELETKKKQLQGQADNQSFSSSYYDWMTGHGGETQDQLAVAQTHAQTLENRLNRMIATGQVDDGVLAGLHSSVSDIKMANLGDPLEAQRKKLDMMPPHLETLPGDSRKLNGYVMLPHAEGKGKGTHEVQTRYQIKDGQIYSPDGKHLVGSIDGPDGKISWVNPGTYIPAQFGMKDLKAAWHLEYANEGGAKQSINWISTGRGIVSVADYKQRAALETEYAKAIDEKSRSELSARDLQRGKDLEKRFGDRLDKIMQNGISGDDMTFLGDGPNKNARAEAFRDKEPPPPPKIEPPKLDGKNVSTVNGKLRHGTNTYEVIKGELHRKTGNGPDDYEKKACGRLGPGYTMVLDNQPPIQLAGESRVLMDFKIGEDQHSYKVMGLGPDRVLRDGERVSGGLVTPEELDRQSILAQEQAANGNDEYFKNRPYLTGDIGNAALGNREQVLHDYSNKISEQRLRLKQELNRAFADGFNPDKFDNNQLDSYTRVTQRLMKDIGADATDANSLAAEAGQLQKQLNDTAVTAAMTVSTAGVGTLAGAAFNVARLTALTQTINISMRSARMLAYTTEFVADGLTGATLSATMRHTDGGGWDEAGRNAYAGFLEGGTMALGSIGGKSSSQVFEALDATGNVSKVTMYGMKGLYQASDAFVQTAGMNAAGAWRDDKVDLSQSLSFGELAMGSAWMLAGKGVAHGFDRGAARVLDNFSQHNSEFLQFLGRNIPQEGLAVRSLNDTIMTYTNSGLAAMPGAVQQQREEIAARLHIPVELVSANMLWEYGNFGKVVQTMNESGLTGAASAPIMTAMSHVLTERITGAMDAGAQQVLHDPLAGDPNFVGQPGVLPQTPEPSGGSEPLTVSAAPERQQSAFERLTDLADGVLKRFEGSAEPRSVPLDLTRNLSSDVQTRADGTQMVREHSGAVRILSPEGRVTDSWDVTGRHITYEYEADRKTLKRFSITDDKGHVTSFDASRQLDGAQAERYQVLPDGGLRKEIVFRSGGEAERLLERVDRRLDGSVEHTDGNGWKSLEPASKDVELAKLRGLIERAVTDNSLRNRISNSLDLLEEQVFFGRLNRNEVAQVYHHLSDLISLPGNIVPESQRPGLLDEYRQRAVADILAMTTYPHFVSQGENLTCNVTTIESDLYRTNPAVPARIVSDMFNYGQFTGKDGKLISWSAPGEELTLNRKSEELRDAGMYKGGAGQFTKEHGAFSPNDRTLASHIFQKTAVNEFWLDKTTDPRSGDHVRPGGLRFDGRKLVRLDGDSPTTVSRSPLIAPVDIDHIRANLTGEPLNRKVLVHFSVEGAEKVNERPGLDSSALPEKQDHAIKSEQHLLKVIEQAQSDAIAKSNDLAARTGEKQKPEFSLTLTVNCDHEPFAKEAHGAHGWHVVNIVGSEQVSRPDGSTETYVLVSNQWGKSKQHLESWERLPLRDVYRATLPTTDIKVSQEGIKEGIRLLREDVATEPNNYLKRLELLRCQMKLSNEIVAELKSAQASNDHNAMRALHDLQDKFGTSAEQVKAEIKAVQAEMKRQSRTADNEQSLKYAQEVAGDLSGNAKSLAKMPERTGGRLVADALPDDVTSAGDTNAPESWSRDRLGKANDFVKRMLGGARSEESKDIRQRSTWKDETLSYLMRDLANKKNWEPHFGSLDLGREVGKALYLEARNRIASGGRTSDELGESAAKLYKEIKKGADELPQLPKESIKRVQDTLTKTLLKGRDIQLDSPDKISTLSNDQFNALLKAVSEFGEQKPRLEEAILTKNKAAADLYPRILQETLQEAARRTSTLFKDADSEQCSQLVARLEEVVSLKLSQSKFKPLEIAIRAEVIKALPEQDLAGLDLTRVAQREVLKKAIEDLSDQPQAQRELVTKLTNAFISQESRLASNPLTMRREKQLSKTANDFTDLLQEKGLFESTTARFKETASQFQRSDEQRVKDAKDDLLGILNQLQSALKNEILSEIESLLASSKTYGRSSDEILFNLEGCKSLLDGLHASADPAEPEAILRLISDSLAGRRQLYLPGRRSANENAFNPSKDPDCCVAATSALLLNQVLSSTGASRFINSMGREGDHNFGYEIVPIMNGRPVVTADHVQSRAGDARKGGYLTVSEKSILIDEGYDVKDAQKPEVKREIEQKAKSESRKRSIEYISDKVVGPILSEMGPDGLDQRRAQGSWEFACLFIGGHANASINGQEYDPLHGHLSVSQRGDEGKEKLESERRGKNEWPGIDTLRYDWNDIVRIANGG